MKETIFLAKDMLDSFLRSKRGEKISDLQYKTLCRHVTQFYNWLPGEKELTKPFLEQWRNDLAEHLGPGSVAQYVTHVNQFLRYCGHEELCFTNRRTLDLTGQRFGRLLALEPTSDQHGKSRSVVWLCRCDCGRLAKASANSLSQGCRVSCGCLRTEKLKNYNCYRDGTSLRQVFSDTLYKNNTSGVRGVYLNRGLWAANITYKGKKYFLGRYAKQEDAASARRQAEAWIRNDSAVLLERRVAP